MLALLLGAATFAALGLAITAAVRSAEGSSAVINIVYLPMAIISGTFFSPHSYPAFLRGLADVLPLTYFVRLAQRIMLHGDDDLGAARSRSAPWSRWGVVGTIAVAVRGFRWQPREG